MGIAIYGIRLRHAEQGQNVSSIVRNMEIFRLGCPFHVLTENFTKNLIILY